MARWTTPARGTWAQAEAMVGQEIARFEGADPVSAADIRRLLELNGLDAPIHTDEAAARAAGYQGIVSPVALLRTWSFPAYRAPGEPPDESGRMHPPVPVMAIPAPSSQMFAADSNVRYLADFHVGDRIADPFDDDAARDTGAHAAYANTIFLESLLEACIRRWAGARARIAELDFRMLTFNLVGDRLRVHGAVREVLPTERTARLELWIESTRAITVRGSATVRFQEESDA
jgi:acyl dehydratase